MNEYINDVDKDYEVCNKIEFLLNILSYISIAISIILCIKYNNIICTLLIIIHIVYIFGDVINDIIFKTHAENERRKTLVSNAYGIDLTEKKAIGYYNNSETNSIKKLGVNVFESAFFTKSNSKMMLKQKTFKFIIDIIIWLIIVLISKDKNIVLCVTQCIFSSEILISYVKLLYFYNKVDSIYDKFYSLFITNKYTARKESQLLEYTLEYECLKSFSHILLSSNNFNKNNKTWTLEWERIRSKIK